MEYIGPVFFGLLLAVFHVLELMVVTKSIKTLILCRKKVDAEVTSVSEEVHEHKDSKTGRVKYSYSYRVTFKYEYNGQTYESCGTSSYCYEKKMKTTIKINPHKPTDICLRGELKSLLMVSLFIPILVMFDCFYVMVVFYSY